jgi:hypothetical protein
VGGSAKYFTAGGPAVKLQIEVTVLRCDALARHLAVAVELGAF